MAYQDPYSPTRPYYECPDCGYRKRTESLKTCAKCDGVMINIAVARE